VAIAFFPDRDEGSFVTRLTGKVTGVDLLCSYREFYESEAWAPMLNELVDVSELDAPDVTMDGLRQLSNYIERLFVERGVAVSYTAVHAPGDLSSGLSRVYEALADESP
jgi:hypothetical protein